MGYDAFQHRISARLTRLYGEIEGAKATDRLLELLSAFRSAERAPRRRAGALCESDVVLISYADSLRAEGQAPLQALRAFLHAHVPAAVSGLHLLPFYPSTSDGGFAVSDFLSVDPALGEWADVHALAAERDLMFDLVLNHVSTSSAWFQQYLDARPPGRDFFIALEPDADVSDVVRPRTHPVLVPFDTQDGVRHVWATFSHDQVDLNYDNPEVLLTMLDVLLQYVRHGARYVRLDAVAFLFKRLGTSCIHLEETHEAVRLIRDVLDAAAPEVAIITETNVPHAENVSYFGQGDEAHMVYQFSLPPLLVHAAFTGQTRYVMRFLQSQTPLPEGCTFFNFIASHDGIGLRPAEDVLPAEEVDRLVRGMSRFGGLVSHRVTREGHRPYEINIALFDAMRGTEAGEDHLVVSRFVAIHSVMMAMQGVPGIYIHSLLGTPNDYEGYDRSKHARDINRRKWDLRELLPVLENARAPQSHIFDEMRRRLTIRRRQPAFAPSAGQHTVPLPDGLVGFVRVAKEQTIVAIHNLRAEPIVLRFREGDGLPISDTTVDLLSGQAVGRAMGGLTFYPYQCVWLSTEP